MSALWPAADVLRADHLRAGAPNALKSGKYGHFPGHSDAVDLSDKPPWGRHSDIPIDKRG